MNVVSATIEIQGRSKFQGADSLSQSVLYMTEMSMHMHEWSEWEVKEEETMRLQIFIVYYYLFQILKFIM